MFRSLIIFLLLSCSLKAQDKLFFGNGQVRTGLVLSITAKQVLFKLSDTAQVDVYNKTDILLLETTDGKRYLFSEKNTEVIPVQVKETNTEHRNSLGIQPMNIFTGRATFIYERFTSNKHVSITIPLILTFDPVGVFYQQAADSNNVFGTRKKGFGFISGVDVNFYPGKDGPDIFYFGPRLRFGKDVFLLNIQAVTLQTQFGVRLGDPTGNLVQHFSAGFGFVRFLEPPLGTRLNRRQSLMWFSINYRLSVSW